MAGQGDMKAHSATYASVISMFKVGTAICVAIAALVVWLIA